MDKRVRLILQGRPAGVPRSDMRTALARSGDHVTIQASTLAVTSMLNFRGAGRAPLDRRSLPVASADGLSDFPEVDYWGVDADGVPAEWVEAAVATSGQWTLVYFHGGRGGVGSVEAGRPPVRRLAVRTGARVFSVGYRHTLEDPHAAAIEDGVSAFAWLLGEGTDLSRTAFIEDVNGSGRAVSVLLRAKDRDLPLPAAGVLPFRVGLTVSGALSKPTGVVGVRVPD